MTKDWWDEDWYWPDLPGRLPEPAEVWRVGDVSGPIVGTISQPTNEFSSTSFCAGLYIKTSTGLVAFEPGKIFWLLGRIGED